MTWVRGSLTTVVLLAGLVAARTCPADCLKTASGKPKLRHEPITVPTPLLMAHAVWRVTPLYPPEAIAAKIDGAVVIAVEVDHDGNVTETRPLSGAASLRPAAEEALRQWRFESFCIKGVPYTVRGAVEFQFRWRGDGSRVLEQ
jgi:TonB family protein